MIKSECYSYNILGASAQYAVREAINNRSEWALQYLACLTGDKAIVAGILILQMLGTDREEMSHLIGRIQGMNVIGWMKREKRPGA